LGEELYRGVEVIGESDRHRELNPREAISACGDRRGRKTPRPDSWPRLSETATSSRRWRDSSQWQPSVL